MSTLKMSASAHNIIHYLIETSCKVQTDQ